MQTSLSRTRAILSMALACLVSLPSMGTAAEPDLTGVWTNISAMGRREGAPSPALALLRPEAKRRHDAYTAIVAP